MKIFRNFHNQNKPGYSTFEGKENFHKIQNDRYLLITFNIEYIYYRFYIDKDCWFIVSFWKYKIAFDSLCFPVALKHLLPWK